MSNDDNAPFKKGDAIEVKIESNQNDSNSKIITWHSAIVLKSTQGTKGKIFVQFTNLTSDENAHLRERVDFCRVRPLPPPSKWWFKVGNRVEVFYEYGWRSGFVMEILEDSKYLVTVDGVKDVSEVDQWRVRMFQEWIDGSWVADDDESLELSDQVNLDDKTVKEIKIVPKKLVVKFEGKQRKDMTLTKKFNIGMRVEVSSDEVGYEGAYYAANVIQHLRNCKYLVEYLILRTNDEKEALREEAEARHVRPCPPYMTRTARYKLFEIVDCWYNDGWWEGEVSKVLPRFKYCVYFKFTKENLVFTHSDLRQHQEWIDGRWYMSSTSKEQTKGTHLSISEENGREEGAVTQRR